MKSETDRVIRKLPTANTIKEGLSKGAEAMVWIDGGGRLNIATKQGWLGIDQRYFAYVLGDDALEDR